MSGIKDFGGFGTDDTESGTEEFESTTAGGNGHADDSKPRDDHSDEAGWDQTTDVKAIEGVGKEPIEDKDKNEDKGTGVDKDKPADKAKDPAQKDDDKDEDDGDDKGDELPEGVKRRVARANRARDREKERADAAEKEAAELRKQIDAKPKDDTATTAPKAEDFDDYEDYLQAKKDFEAKPKPKVEDKPADEDKPRTPDRELVGAVKEIEATLADAGHGDLFKQVVESKDVDVTRDMAIAIAELDNPETVLQAFLDDPALSKSIADLKTPTARLKALVKLDVPYVKSDAAKADETKAKAKPAPKGSDAPDPIDETNGNAHGDAGYDGLTFNEFEKRRNAEEKASKDFW